MRAIEGGTGDQLIPNNDGDLSYKEKERGELDFLLCVVYLTSPWKLLCLFFLCAQLRS